MYLCVCVCVCVCVCLCGVCAICVCVEVIVSEYEVEGARKMGFQEITWRTLYVSH